MKQTNHSKQGWMVFIAASVIFALFIGTTKVTPVQRTERPGDIFDVAIRNLTNSELLKIKNVNVPQWTSVSTSFDVVMQKLKDMATNAQKLFSSPGADTKLVAATDKDKKKKKKKKKEPKQTPVSAPQAEEETVAKHESPAQTPPLAPMGPPAQPAVNGAEAQVAGGVPHNANEWEKLILSGLDFKNVQKMIEAYRSGEITAETFYSVIDKMLGDDREQMREFGVAALGATPSAESFVNLISYTQKEATVNKARMQAQNILKSYGNLENLRLLRDVVGVDTDVTVEYFAIRVVKLSAQNYLKQASTVSTASGAVPSQVDGGTSSSGGATSGDREPSTESSKRATLNLNKYFLPFVAPIQKVAQSARDENLRASASATLLVLEQLLGLKATAGVAAGAGAQGSGA